MKPADEFKKMECAFDWSPAPILRPSVHSLSMLAATEWARANAGRLIGTDAIAFGALVAKAYKACEATFVCFEDVTAQDLEIVKASAFASKADIASMILSSAAYRPDGSRMPRGDEGPESSLAETPNRPNPHSGPSSGAQVHPRSSTEAPSDSTPHSREVPGEAE